MGMTKQELIEKLKALHEDVDPDWEASHYKADNLLIEFINDPEISVAFEEVGKWYA